MPGTVPAGDETVLYALPEDQPDSLSKGHKSKQADLDGTPAEKRGDKPAEPEAAPVAKKAPAKKSSK